MMRSRQSVLGSIVSLWRYPVKSMMGELNAVKVTKGGMTSPSPRWVPHTCSRCDGRHRQKGVPGIDWGLERGTLYWASAPCRFRNE